MYSMEYVLSGKSKQDGLPEDVEDTPIRLDPHQHIRLGHELEVPLLVKLVLTK
jgi:hypothetical protein